MIDKKYLEDLYKIADTQGYEEQSMQLIEEMAELTQAINKHRRYRTNETLGNLIEEIADVSIVLEQVNYLVGYDIAFDGLVKQKIERTKKRIAENGRNIKSQRELAAIIPKDKMMDLLIKDKESKNE